MIFTYENITQSIKMTKTHKKRKKGDSSSSEGASTEADDFDISLITEAAINNALSNIDENADFETFVRQSLSAMKHSMLKQQTSLEEVIQNQTQIKSDIKGVNTKIAKLTTRVTKIEDQIKPIIDDITSVKSTIEATRANISDLTKTQTTHSSSISQVKTQCQNLTPRMAQAEDNVSKTSKDVSTNKNSIHALDEEMNAVYKRTTNVEDDLYKALTDLQNAREHCNRLERFSRENNLRVLNFQENPNENVFHILKNVCALVGIPDVEIMKAHRTGKQSFNSSGRPVPRHIIFKLLRHSDKQFLLQNQRRALANEHFHIIEDMTEADLQTKHSLRDVIEKAKQEQKRWKFRNGKLIIDGEVYNKYD